MRQYLYTAGMLLYRGKFSKISRYRYYKPKEQISRFIADEHGKQASRSFYEVATGYNYVDQIAP